MPGPHLRTRHLKSWEDVEGCDFWVDTYYDDSKNQQFTMGWHIPQGGVFGPLIGLLNWILIGHEKWIDDFPVEGWHNVPNPGTSQPGCDLSPKGIMHWWWVWTRRRGRGYWKLQKRYLEGIVLIDFLQFAADVWPWDYCAAFNLSPDVVERSWDIGWPKALNARDVEEDGINAGKGILAVGKGHAQTYKGKANAKAAKKGQEPNSQGTVKGKVKGKGKGKRNTPKGKGPENVPEECPEETMPKGKGKNKGQGKNK